MQLQHINERLDEVHKEVTKSKEEAAENLKHKSPFAPEIRDKPVPTNFRLPVLESYDGSSDPIEHVAAFGAQMALYDSSDALMCQVFLTTLRGPARMWYDHLQPASIISFDQLARELEQNFLANARSKPTTASLLGIAQGREEPLTQFVNRFTTESRAIPDVHPSLVIQAFLMGIRPSKLLWSLVEKPPTIVPEMMQRANHFITETDRRKAQGAEASPNGTTSGTHLETIEEEDRGARLKPLTTPDDSPQLHAHRDFSPNKGEGASGTTKPHQDQTRGKGQGQILSFPP
ncbi:hypothetical protein BHM03_00022837 [Ensete ventricosum]|nr:hypothetical protein BHM03_00022837 [Ensete ventricosum]